MEQLTLSVYSRPQPKQRPRVVKGHAHTPAATVEAEQRIRRQWMREHPGRKPWQGEVGLILDFWLYDRRVMDWDNLGKLVSDALNGLAYADDSQVREALIRKHYPDTKVMGRNLKIRNRHSGDPLTYGMKPMDAHTDIIVMLYEDGE